MQVACLAPVLAAALAGFSTLAAARCVLLLFCMMTGEAAAVLLDPAGFFTGVASAAVPLLALSDGAGAAAAAAFSGFAAAVSGLAAVFSGLTAAASPALLRRPGSACLAAGLPLPCLSLPPTSALPAPLLSAALLTVALLLPVAALAFSLPARFGCGLLPLLATRAAMALSLSKSGAAAGERRRTSELWRPGDRPLRGGGDFCRGPGDCRRGGGDFCRGTRDLERRRYSGNWCCGR